MEKKSASGGEGFETMIHFWRIKLKPQHLWEKRWLKMDLSNFNVGGSE